MNKSELIEAIADGSGITKVAAGKALDVMISAITQSLTDGVGTVIPGFGSFTADTRAARVGRNPRTGEAIQIKASRVVKFKVGKTLKEAVQ